MSAFTADLRRAGAALPTMLRVAWAGMVAYRAEMVIWILTATLPLVMLALWNAASADGPIGAFGQVDFARYFAINLFVRQLTGSWAVWELNNAIRTGAMSPWLLRPIHPLLFNLCETACALPFRVIVLLPVLGALFWWRPEIAFVPSLSALLCFSLSVALAFALSFAIQCIFGILSFWLDQSMGLFQAWFALWAFLSGYFVPLSLLPAPVIRVARFLPFHASLGAPIELLMGQEPRPLFALGVQAAWVVVTVALSAILWKRGVKRYGAYGA